jgi:hypothetical protein
MVSGARRGAAVTALTFRLAAPDLQQPFALAYRYDLAKTCRCGLAGTLNVKRASWS